MIAKVTALYALPLCVLYVVLSYRVIGIRKRLRVGLGDGGDSSLNRAIRVHGNFSEYVPLALIVIALVEINGAWPWLVHILGLLLLAGRCAHAWGVSQPVENFRFRVFGMLSTFAVMVGGAAVALLA